MPKIHDCEQRSEAWERLRCGRPTASEFSSIVTSEGKPSKSRAPYARRLAAELFGGPGVNQWGGNMDLERGRFLEDEARRHYAFMRDVEVRQVGFITDDDETVGCSPDGLVGEDGGLEIKCLNAERHTEVVMRWHDKREINPDYVAQPQGCLLVTRRVWWDVMFYHYCLPPLIIRRQPDATYHAALNEGIAEVIAERDRIVRALHELRDGIEDKPTAADWLLAETAVTP